MMEAIFTGLLGVYRENQFLRDHGRKGDLSELGSGEYFSFCVRIQNLGDRTIQWDQASVRVDDAEPLRWPKGQLPPARHALFHINYKNMQKYMTPGAHTVVWYFDGKAMHQERFILTRNLKWEALFPIPSRQEIANYRNPCNRRSPYIAGWLDIPAGTRYSEFMIDFQAAHLPRGTYCCLGSWTMDYSSLKKRFRSVRTESQWTHAYAGFQRLSNGQTASILSFWDVYCKDASGAETTLRAKRTYPETVIGGGSFGGEGTGARGLVPFDWEAGHWYRMHLKCATSPQTGNTLVEQWVRDLETGKHTLLCRYDTGVANSAFQGSIAVFLENFLPETAGQVRSMEIRNARYLNAFTKRWHTVTKAQLSSQGGTPQYEGSYDFGVSEDRVWMITSGVGGDWFHNGKGKKATTVTIL